MIGIPRIRQWCNRHYRQHGRCMSRMSIYVLVKKHYPWVYKKPFYYIIGFMDGINDDECPDETLLNTNEDYRLGHAAGVIEWEKPSVMRMQGFRYHD